MSGVSSDTAGMVHRSLGLDSSPTTRFGATSDVLQRSAGVLRARASRAGLELRPASTVDLAAAVVAVDSWMAVLRTPTLDQPARHGRAAVRALAAALSRSAGHGGPVEPVEPCGATDDLLDLAAGHARWAAAILGVESAAEALRRSASDLYVGGDLEVLHSLACALYLTAEDLPELA